MLIPVFDATDLRPGDETFLTTNDGCDEYVGYNNSVCFRLSR